MLRNLLIFTLISRLFQTPWILSFRRSNDSHRRIKTSIPPQTKRPAFTPTGTSNFYFLLLTDHYRYEHNRRPQGTSSTGSRPFTNPENASLISTDTPAIRIDTCSQDFSFSVLLTTSFTLSTGQLARSGAKQHVAHPCERHFPLSHRTWCVYLVQLQDPSSSQVAIHAFTSRPERLFQSSAYKRSLSSCSSQRNYLLPANYPRVPMLNSRVQLPNLLDGVDSIHYGRSRRFTGCLKSNTLWLERYRGIFLCIN